MPSKHCGALLVEQVVKQKPRFAVKAVDHATGMERIVFSLDKWVESGELEEDIRTFVRSGHIRPLEEKIIVDDAVADDFRKALDSTFPEGAVAPPKEQNGSGL